MSALYCTITESARRTQPTARAHKAASVSVKNWQYEIVTRMTNHGGGGQDEICVTLRSITTGRYIVLSNDHICNLMESTAALR